MEPCTYSSHLMFERVTVAGSRTLLSDRFGCDASQATAALFLLRRNAEWARTFDEVLGATPSTNSALGLAAKRRKAGRSRNGVKPWIHNKDIRTGGTSQEPLQGFLIRSTAQPTPSTPL
jgi:hypothetical protein